LQYISFCTLLPMPQVALAVIGLRMRKQIKGHCVHSVHISCTLLPIPQVALAVIGLRMRKQIKEVKVYTVYTSPSARCCQCHRWRWQ
jgi:hypothetical protein